MDIGYLYRSDEGVEAHIYAPRPFQAPRLLRLGLDGAPVDFRRISDMQDQQATSGQKP